MKEPCLANVNCLSICCFSDGHFWCAIVRIARHVDAFCWFLDLVCFCLKLVTDFPLIRCQYTLNDLAALVNKMHKDWRVLSLTDLVFNHTSKDSPWVLQHPECAYNLDNSPHLRPAYLIDRILYYFNKEVAEGKWESSGVPAEVSEECHLQVQILLINLKYET